MWRIEISKRCLRELRRAPAPVQARFEELFLARESVQNPFDRVEMGAALEKLEGGENCYKVRIGKHRVGLYLDKPARALKVVTVFPRATDYRSFP